MAEETRWLTPDQQRAWRGLVVGMTLLMDRLDDDLRREHGVSLTEYEILVRLSEREEGRMRMAQLADSLAHSRSRVTHTVQRMERAGLVTRSHAVEDGRGVFAVLTEEGRGVIDRAAHLHVRGVRENLVDLVSEEDFAVLGRVMNQVTDQLISRHPAMEIR